MKKYLLIATTLMAFNSWSMVELQEVSRDEIIEYAKTGLGTPYKLGGSKWVTNGKSGEVDCAGLVLKSWRWPIYTKPEDKLKWVYKVGRDIESSAVTMSENITYVFGKLHTSALNKNPIDLRLYSSKGHDKSTTEVEFPWSIQENYINFTHVKKGDAFDKYHYGDKYGHIFLVDEVIRSDLLLSIEAVRPHVGQLKRSYSKTKQKSYKFMRRNNITANNREDLEIVPLAPVVHETVIETTDIQPELISVPKYHTVIKGDSLYEIAQAFGTTLKHIKRLNPQIKNINVIVVGQKIRVK